VQKNAEQLNLTGVVIYNPNLSLVYVEGAAKFIRQYKRLMQYRITWTEAARARGEEEVVLEGNGSADTEDVKGKSQVHSEEKDATSLDNNRCDLVWEGQIRDRTFPSFRARSCPTDAVAREVLGAKMMGYWDMAKNWKPEDEELF